MVLPNWARARVQSAEWSAIGASHFIVRQLMYGVRDLPTLPFVPGQGRRLRAASLEERDHEFLRCELRDGCAQGYYRNVDLAYVERSLAKGHYLSTIFVDWRNGSGRLITNFKEVSRHWNGQGVRMDTLTEFGACLVHSDTMISFDLRGGYRTVALHVDMIDMFMFTYAGEYYVCLTLPFGWSRSPYWFLQVMKPLTRHLRLQLRCRALPYLDDYLLVPGLGEVAATPADCLHLSAQVDALLTRLGLVRHPTKGVWGCGSRRLEHLGVVVDTLLMRFFITPAKLQQLHHLAKALLLDARRGQSTFLVRADVLQIFLGKAISNLTPLPLARFYSRSLYDCLKGTMRGGKVRLSRAALLDLKTWRTLSAGDGRLMYSRRDYSWTVHTDAADVGWGATIGTNTMAGSPGQLEVQRLWSPFTRLASINLRELQAIRLTLEQKAVRLVLHAPTRQETMNILLHVDNMGIVQIVNNMVTASPKLMKELRLLHNTLEKLKIRVHAHWLPSALNRHADRLSRTWNPNDAFVTASLLRSVSTSLHLQQVRRYWPLNESPAARSKVLKAQFLENWGDGRSRLWSPPPELIHLTLRKIDADGGHGIILVPNWTGQPWFGLLRIMAQEMRVVTDCPQPSVAHSLPGPLRNPKWTVLAAEVRGRHSEGLLSAQSQHLHLPLQEVLLVSGWHNKRSPMQLM